MEIFCDESGFTGNQLLDKDQQIYSYASVALSSENATRLVERIRSKYRLQADELKGSTLLKQARGRPAITEILKALEGDFRVAVHLKPYALSCKFFEYIFEPAFSECNSIFYEIDFHRFIATLLFVYFRARDIDAAKLLDDFCRFARKGDIAALELIFPSGSTANYKQDVLSAIGLFAQLHREKITDEVLGPRERGVPNWLLDLTTTSLYHSLVLWGEIHGPLEVTCDEAKPLAGDSPVFDAMVGRTGQTKVRFQGVERSLLFNLSRPLKLAKSHEIAGLQLADVVASAASLAWKKLYDDCETPESKQWRQLIAPGLIAESIWPDLENADLDNAKTFGNTAVLIEIVERSLTKKDLCTGIYEFYQFAVRVHPGFLIETASKAKRIRKRGNRPANYRAAGGIL